MHRAIEHNELRKHAVDDSLGSVRLEDLDPSFELVSDLKSWAAGRLEMQQVRKRMLDRFAQQDVEALPGCGSHKMRSRLQFDSLESSALTMRAM